MSPLIYVLGEIGELGGFFILLLPKVIIITMIGAIPFLFFKKTRNWKTIISILFIIAGWFYGEIIAGNYYLNFYQMNISNPRIFAFGILSFYFIIFATTPMVIFKFIKRRKWKHLLWSIPLLVVYIGLKINWLFIK